jgi:NAD-dependent DNA ligase
MAEEKLYVREVNLLNKKAAGFTLNWIEIPAMIKVQTEQLSEEKANNTYNKLVENMKKKAGMHLNKLILLIPIKSMGGVTAARLFRVVVDITLLRQLFADELGDWGGGGRRLKNEQTPLSTTMRRR